MLVGPIARDVIVWRSFVSTVILPRRGAQSKGTGIGHVTSNNANVVTG